MIINLIKKIFSRNEEFYKNKYLESGLDLGDIMTSPYMGFPINYDKYLNDYLKMEAKIIKLGFIPISLDKFALRAGWGRDVDISLIKGNDKKKINEIKEENMFLIKEYEMIAKNPLDFYEIKQEGNIIKGKMKD